MGDLRYGPATDDVLALRGRYDANRAGVCAQVGRWSQRLRADLSYRRLKLPRDFAWHRFHAGLDAHAQTPAFQRLWDDLRAAEDGLPPLDVADAICATMLAPFLDDGPFTPSDFDTLLVPWRAGMDGCVRSRLYTVVAAHPPFDRDFWPAVDAALADTGAG